MLIEAKAATKNNIISVKETPNILIISCLYAASENHIKQKSDIEEKERFNTSIANSRRNIRELFLCNDFEYFVSITLGRDIGKTENADKIMKTVCQKLANFKKRKSGWKDLQYVLVPERYNDRRKRFHVHGLFKGIDEDGIDSFQEISSAKKIPKYAQDAIDSGRSIFFEKDLSKDFGFNVIDPIINQSAVENYLIQELQEAAEWRQSGSHLYYASKGLNRAEKIITGHYDSSTLDAIEKIDGVKSKLLRPYNSSDCFGVGYSIPYTVQNKALLYQLIGGDYVNSVTA